MANKEVDFDRLVFDFSEDPDARGYFFMEVIYPNNPLHLVEHMSRREAEELMHQMVFVLGYKLAN